MPNSFLQTLPPGLVIIASPDVWNEEKRQLCHEFCSTLRQRQFDEAPHAAALQFNWDDEDWADEAWLRKRLAGFSRQIEADQARGVLTFTICRPTNLYPEACLPFLGKLRALAISKGVSILVVTHAKRRSVVAQAKENPFAAIRHGKALEGVVDGGGVLIPAKSNDYSLVIKEKNGLVRVFNNVITFPVRTENSQKYSTPPVSPATVRQLGTGSGCITVISVSILVVAAWAAISW
jgi:hypothetical protein